MIAAKHWKLYWLASKPAARALARESQSRTASVANDPIEFDSIDNKPVNIILLLVSPPDQTGPHIQALARISRLMLDEQFKSQLENAATPEEVYDLISTRETE
ncbi:MAG: PTS sugar transporter subunit IIA [Planctomycetota bacterium]